jgi:glycosyltransferase involved in cell wall biosynthesis
LFDAAPIFLLPVRITPRKNIEQALRVMSVLKADLPDARLVVTGPMGPHNPKNLGYFNELLALRDRLDLKGQVSFLAEISREFLPDAVVADFYRLSDALLLPSREEGFGIPVLEAGISGLPVFCADIPPLRELAGEQGVFFSPDVPPEQVAALITRKLSHDAGFRLRSRVRTSFTWEKLYQQHIQPLLREV